MNSISSINEIVIYRLANDHQECSSEQIKEDKSRPYLNVGRSGEVAYLNGQVNVGQLFDGVVCRHFAAQFVLAGLSSQDGRKVLPHKLFGTHDLIQENIAQDIETQVEKLRKHAHARYIIDPDKFGTFLANRAERIEENKSKYFQIYVYDHVMAFELKRKNLQKYVVRFYDPNLTNVVARCEVSNRRDFIKNTNEENASYKLEDFLYSEFYSHYFKRELNNNKSSDCLIYEYSHGGEVTASFTTLDGTSPEKPSPEYLYHLLADGMDPEAIKGLAQRLKHKDRTGDELLAILQARSAYGTPGLLEALTLGHSSAIAAYGSLLGLLSPEQREHSLVELLTTKNDEGMSGLCAALWNGRSDAIAAYGSLLGHLSAEQKAQSLVEILTAKDDRGRPGLHVALWHDRSDAISAYGSLLGHLSAEQKAQSLVELLTAKHDKGRSGLHEALAHGRSDAIAAYGSLLEKHLSPEQREHSLVELLAAKNDEGTPGLSMALAHGRSDAIAAYGSLLELLSPEQKAHSLVELLAAKIEQGALGLSSALLYGHSSAIEAYGSLLELLSPEQKAQLCEQLLIELPLNEPSLDPMPQQAAVEAYQDVLRNSLLIPQMIK